MRKQLLAIILISLAVLMTLAAWGCKNPDEDTDPIVPPPVTGQDIDPSIPEPFAYPIQPVIDIGIEGDGDIALATAAGMELFTPYGVHKRLISPNIFWGIATSNFGWLDTGRGVMALLPDAGCVPSPSYDDLYVTGGVPHVSYDPAWWAGEPDPYYPDIPIDIASGSAFSSCDCTPHPISYHPLTSFAYQKVYTPECIADTDVAWPIQNTVPIESFAILAYHPDAPLPPDYMSYIFQGGVDFLVYYDYPTYMNAQNLAAMLGIVPACALHNLYIIWDWTSMTYMSSRSGMTVSNVCDFEFDMLNRLVIAMPNADSFVITDPVIFGQPIVIQQTIGGRQNGMGTLPGEFQGPTAVAIDPRNQNILISDTGNGRVQIFDNDGNFIREFGGADTTFVPSAIRVDAFGAIYVSNISALRAEGDNLRIYNEYGAPVVYGTLEGFVYDKDTHIPIDNARVRVMSTFLPLDDFTDGDGHFIFPAIAAGTHDITSEKYNFNAGQVNAVVVGGQKTVVDIYLDRVGVNPPGYGQITGTVFSLLTNEPVPGLTVEVVGQGVSNQTNGNGEFTLYNVPEGEHVIKMSANGVIYYESYITVTKGGIVDLGVLYLQIP